MTSAHMRNVYASGAAASGKLFHLRLPFVGTIAIDPRTLAAQVSLAAIFLLCALGPFMSYKPAPFTGEGSPQRQVAYILVLLLTLYSANPLADYRRLAVMPLSLVLVFAWCWISLSWALNPSIAIRRLSLTTLLAFSIFLAVRRAGYESSLAIMRTVMVVILAANFAAVVGWPAMGIHQAGEVGDEALVGNWRGIMLQKNFAGATCAFTILAFLFDAQKIRGWIRIAVIVAATFFLVRSMSKTSMGILVMAMACGGLFILYRPRYRLLLPPLFIVGAVAVGLAIYLNWDAIMAPYYRQDTLTGRVQIWPAMFAYAKDHLLLGTGYGSFWNIGEGRGPIFEYASGWVVGYAAQGHNGYIDLLVTIGLPGLIMAILATLIVPLTRLLASLTVTRQSGAMLSAIILFCAGHNLTESSLMDRDTIVQVYLITALALIALQTGRQVPLVARPRPQPAQNSGISGVRP